MTRNVVLALAACCALAGVGCGSSSDESNDGASSAASTVAAGDGASSVVAQAKSHLNTYYSNSSVAPPADGPAAVKGKRVVFVDAGLSTPAGAEGARAVKEAGKLLGWKVSVFDGKFTPSVYQEGIRQAISSKADGIVMFGVDCPLVKTALEQAKQAKVPVVSASGQDCSQSKDGGPELFSASVEYPPLPGTKDTLSGFTQWYGQGVAQADWLIATTNGKAKVLLFEVPDFAVTDQLAQGFKDTIKKCSDCSIADTVKLGVKDFGPNLQDIAQQALLKNPSADSVVGAYADPMTLGIAGAIRTSGRADKLHVVAGTGNSDELDLVRNDKGENAGFVQVISWDMYGAFDQLNRIFAGTDLAVTGYPVTLYDKDHNLPASGPYVPKADYKSVFSKIWAGS
ncbi:MAG TPA: substrate-binding domain-containing protein [Baekduia sp.]|nr:substrate-binding domain-containing protein [Baekduia sp.]